MKNVLSILGGGIYGIGVTRFLKLVRDSIADMRDYCNVFAGVSAGAIITALLATGKNSRESDEIFMREYKSMFKKNNVFTRMRPSKGRYNSASVEKVLRKYIGDVTFKDLDVDLYIGAFRSYTPNDEYSDNYFVFSKESTPDVKVWEAVRCSMAAKPYFEPYIIDGVEYCDGGYIENNPSMTAITELIAKGESKDNIKILQLNTAGSTKNIRFTPLTLVALAKNFITRTMQGDSSVSTIQARNCIEDRLCVVNPYVIEDYGLDGIEHVESIREMWEKAYYENFSKVMLWTRENTNSENAH